MVEVVRRLTEHGLGLHDRLVLDGFFEAFATNKLQLLPHLPDLVLKFDHKFLLHLGVALDSVILLG